MKKGLNSGKRVFVALSGGVDSSVSAALLKEAGYDVTGVFIKVWQPPFLPCSWRDERRDAMRVAAKLKIPFLTFDLEREYKRDVVDYMVHEYKAGRTPNPDVMCNKYVKFGEFYRRARKMGADFIATGHYARISNKGLLAAADGKKDQSYFLWTMSPDVLARVFFPIGGYKKLEVRMLAKKFGLFTSQKKDSQGLCFVGKLDMKEFLSHYIKPMKGDILDKKGRTIGFHDGAYFFTPGERHGFVVAKKSSSDEPLFVLSKDMKKNTITVGKRKDMSQKNNSEEITLLETNWVSGLFPKKRTEYRAVSRYHAVSFPVKIKEVKKGRAVISASGMDGTTAPGQSLVIYAGQICVGGGIIS